MNGSGSNISELFQNSGVKEIYDKVAGEQDLNNNDFYLYSGGKYQHTTLTIHVQWWEGAFGDGPLASHTLILYEIST